jgi:hypothetical protein
MRTNLSRVRYLLLLAPLVLLSSIQVTAQETYKSTERASQTIVREGVAVEFKMDPAAGKSELMELEDAVVTFTITEAKNKKPVTGLNLAGWLKLRDGDKAPDEV